MAPQVSLGDGKRMSRTYLGFLTAGFGLVGIVTLIELLSLDHGSPPVLVAVFVLAAAPQIVLTFGSEQFDRQVPPLVGGVASYVLVAVVCVLLISFWVQFEPVTVFLGRRFLVGQLKTALISGFCLGFATHFGLRLRKRRY